jgi:deoxyribodipyrimidine photolyase-related protein
MASSIFVVFPHQLFKALFTFPRTQPFCFIEDERYFRQLPFHKHKLVLHRASMQAVRERLLVKGFQVSYFDTLHAPTLEAVFKDLRKQKITTIEHYELVDDDVEKRLEKICTEQGITRNILPTPAFLAETSWLLKKFQRATLTTDKLYQAQRRSLNLLIEDGKPVGGNWRVGKKGHTTLPKGHVPPPVHLPEYNRYVEEASEYVQKNFPTNPGLVDHFVFPITYADAEDWLEDFIHHRLSQFATYQDELSAREVLLYHAGILPALNCGLLTPQQVVEAAVVYHKHHSIPLPSLEAFLYHVVGIREYFRAWYILPNRPRLQPSLPELSKKVPVPFEAAATGLVPLDTVLQRVHTLAFCHTTDQLRLLLPGFYLFNVKPQLVYTWYMTMLIEAYDWMAQPLIYTYYIKKPTLLSAREILRHSDYPSGKWEKQWDMLYKKVQK